MIDTPRRRLAAAELAAALLVGAGFAGLAWTGLGYRGAAAYLPVAASAMGAVSALVWAWQCLRRLRAVTGRQGISRPGLIRVAILIAAALGYLLLIPGLGFFTASLVFMLVSTLAMGQRPLWQAGAASALLAVGLWLVFRVVLDSYLPTDLIFGN